MAVHDFKARDQDLEKGILKKGGNENVEKEKKKSKTKRKKKSRKGFYSHDELIRLWYSDFSQKCPQIPPIVLKSHEVHEKGDQTKDKVVFPIEKRFQELPQEIKAIKTRNFKKVHGRPRDFYSYNGFDYKV